MEYFRIAAALGTVFALLGSVYFFSNRARTRLAASALRATPIWPRKGQHAKPAEDSVRLLKRVTLTATHQLHLVETARDRFLLCTHPHGCTLLPSSISPVSDAEGIASDELGRYAS